MGVSTTARVGGDLVYGKTVYTTAQLPQDIEEEDAPVTGAKDEEVRALESLLFNGAEETNDQPSMTNRSRTRRGVTCTGFSPLRRRIWNIASKQRWLKSVLHLSWCDLGKAHL